MIAHHGSIFEYDVEEVEMVAGEQIGLRIKFVGPVIDRELADEIVRAFSEAAGTEPAVSYETREPPAYGMSEIAVVVEFTANAAELLVLLGGLVAALAGNRLNTPVFDRLFKRGRLNKREDRVYVPLSIELGHRRFNAPVRFHFHQTIMMNEFHRRLKEAERLVEALPPQAFDGPLGPSEYGFFWDSESDQWRGQIYSPDSEENFWVPPDLWVADDPK